MQGMMARRSRAGQLPISCRFVAGIWHLVVRPPLYIFTLSSGVYRRGARWEQGRGVGKQEFDCVGQMATS